MKISDLIGVALIVLGILMTVLNLLTARQPIADAQSLTVHELQSPRSEIAPRGAGSNL
jgi:hypothetical protein